MKHEEILASVSVLVLAGVIVYATKVGILTAGGILHKKDRISASQLADSNTINSVGGDPNQLVNGPSIYVSNTPFPFWPPIGNVIPPNSATTTIGAANGDFLGFSAS